MSRFIETICFEKGDYPLLPFHQQRVDESFNAFFQNYTPHKLSEVLPKLDFEEKYKVRIVYDAESVDIEWSLHHKRSVKSLQCIPHESIDYQYKYEDRKELESLYNKRGQSDEVLIIKHGMVTDAFYYNPVFWDGAQWYFPETCLLNGIMRRFLIANHQIRTIPISVNDITNFEKVSLVNALTELGEIEVSIEDILLHVTGDAGEK